jgi:hypothetical protein
MIVAHLFGLPVEETAAQLGPAAGVTVTMMCIAGRSRIARLLTRLRPGSWMHTT